MAAEVIMNPIRRLLVDVDVLAPEHPALLQAFDVASRLGAAVTITDVLPDVPRGARRFVTAEVEQELVEDRRTRLAALAESAPAGVEADSLVLRGRAGVALVEHVLRGNYELLLRAHNRRPGEERPFGAVDMQLLRQCPCPVWLVARGMPVPPRHVMAAIDASEIEGGDPSLNRSLVDLAVRVSGPANGPVAVVYAWDAFGEELMEPRLSLEEFQQFVGAAEQTASDCLAAFTGELGPGATRLAPQLVKGVPEDAIPAFVREHGIDLLVMGTAARSGMAGWLIGNTAERVLQRVRVSVLAVKPHGFVSPMTIGG